MELNKNKVIVLTILFVVILVLSYILFVSKTKDEKKNNQIYVEEEQFDEIADYLDLLESSLMNSDYTYTTNKSIGKNISSILITITKGSGIRKKMFLSYTIENKTKKVLNNQEIAEMFGYSLDDIPKKIENKLSEYYNNEIKKGYVNKLECNLECYIKGFRQIDDIEHSYVFYIKNDKLYAYVSMFDNQSIKGYFQTVKFDPYAIEL